MAYLHIYSIYARVLLIFPNFAIKLSHTRKIEATEDVEIWTGLTGFTSIEEDGRVEMEKGRRVGVSSWSWTVELETSMRF